MGAPSPESAKSRAFASLAWLESEGQKHAKHLLNSDQIPQQTRRLLGVGEKAVELFRTLASGSEELKGGKGKGVEWLISIIALRANELLRVVPEETLISGVRKVRDMLNWVVGD